MESVERARLDAYFTKITSRFRPDEQPSSFLVTHLLPERPSFVRGVAATSTLRAVLPKPKSISPAAKREVEGIAPCDPLSREVFADADLDKLPCPVVSVARSPLKDPEDFLVGQSVVFSTEALMRERGDILHGRPALVIGFGKLGSSIARLLHAKGVQVTVHDIDPIRRTQALSQGFTVARDRDNALHSAGLVLCATGAISLRSEDFSTLRNGAYVATVTSSEDELDLASLPGVYDRSRDTEHITRYQTTGHYFYLLNGGNAVNFLHGASVGPFIFLVQAEILAAIRMLARADLPAGVHEVPAADRTLIADTWLTYFNR